MSESKKYTREDYDKDCATDGLEEAEKKLQELEEQKQAQEKEIRAMRREINREIREQKEIVEGRARYRYLNYLKLNAPEHIDTENDIFWAYKVVDYLKGREPITYGTDLESNLGPNSDDDSDDSDGDGIHMSQY